MIPRNVVQWKYIWHDGRKFPQDEYRNESGRFGLWKETEKHIVGTIIDLYRPCTHIVDMQYACKGTLIVPTSFLSGEAESEKKKSSEKISEAERKRGCTPQDQRKDKKTEERTNDSAYW